MGRQDGRCRLIGRSAEMLPEDESDAFRHICDRVGLGTPVTVRASSALALALNFGFQIRLPHAVITDPLRL